MAKATFLTKAQSLVLFILFPRSFWIANCLEGAHCDLISHSLWVHSFRAASAGTKLSVLVLFGYAQTTLNEKAIFALRPHAYDKGLLPNILL